jgi:hypothetical protein
LLEERIIYGIVPGTHPLPIEDFFATKALRQKGTKRDYESLAEDREVSIKID